MTRFSHENWPLLSPLLDEALELPPEARDSWLAQHRISHPSLAAELEALLNGEEELERDGFLDPATAPVHPAVSSLAGQRLGAYVLERPIGQGGMGSVWLARRSDGRFESAVAIKFLSLAVAGPAGEARFRREGNLLARLTHPNIARLLDAGVSPEGQPYLVLEHVDGLPLDAWCDQRRLPVEARLRLVQQVIAAVAHAHANLIVHRDLKPANILVTPDGTVKLLDFGIAKLLEQGDEGRSILTGSHEAVLTFEYAAPEQIQGDPISTSTDVYSLGVILYQLLSGRHPTSGSAITPGEHVRAILEVDPPVLSRALAPSGTLTVEEAARLAAARDSSPDRLRRWYAGDLDNILAKALRKNPAQRYPSVMALGDDLARYLGHEPVLARPDTWTYRAAKFFRRHRGSVSSAILVAILLIAAAVLTTFQAREARYQRDTAILQLKRTRAMNAVQRVLASDSRGANGKQLSLSERILLASSVLQRQFATEPWVVSEVMTDLAGSFYETGDRASERAILLDAQHLARNAGTDPQLALANCQRVYSFAYDDLFDSATADLAEAKAAIARSRDLPNEVMTQCLDAEAALLVEQGHPDSAVPLMARAVALAQADHVTGPPDPTYIGQLLNDYAQALRASGRTREAARYQVQLFASMDSAGYGETDILPNAAAFMVGSLNELGEFAVEDSILGSLVRAQERTRGPGNAMPIVGFLYGSSLFRAGQIDSADRWMTGAVRDTSSSGPWTQTWGPPAMAELRLVQHLPADAKPYVGRVPEGPGSFAFRVPHLKSWLRYEQGDRKGALTALEAAIQRLSKPGPLPRLAPLLLLDSQWHLAAGDGAGADSLARRAITAAAVDTLTLTRSGWVGLAELLSARGLALQGQLPAARSAASRAIVALTNGTGPDQPYTRQARALNDSLSH